MADQTPLKGIIPWFAGNPVAANLLMVLVIALGALSMGSLQKEAFPSREPDKLNINVSFDSGSARQSEEGIAIKIEDALEGVTGIDSVTSSSTASGATVTVEREPEYDLDVLLRDVKAKVNAISNFPAAARKPVITKAEREEHALWIQLYGDASRRSLQQLTESLKKDLLAHPDISRVAISGWLDPLMAVEVDEGKLQAYGLSLTDVEDAINQGSSSATTAVLHNEHLYLQLKASEQAYLKQDFAKLPLIDSADGHQVLLGDIARINDTFDDTTSTLSRFAGKDSIALQVITTGTDDISDSANGAREVVNRWRADNRLPENVQLSTWYDRSTSINERLELLINNAIFGIVLVFVLLALFLNLRVAFWVAMGLPFIFFGTLYFMGDSFVGLTLNEFTTFGFIMALGIVVDDAVVVGESVYAVRSSEGDTLENTIKGTMRVAVPTLFGVFTTVAAFYALSQISGGLGHLYAQFAAVVSLCLVLSIIESKLILPAHLAHLNTRRTRATSPLLKGWQAIQNSASNGMEWVSQRAYKPLITLALRFRYTVVILFVAVLLLVLAMPFNGAIRMSFFPEITGDTVRAHVSMYNDASFGLTHKALEKLESAAHKADKALRGDDNDVNDNVDDNQTSAIANLQVLSSSDQSGKITVELTADAPYDIHAFTRRWKALAGTPEGVRSLSVRSHHGSEGALRVELRASNDDILVAAGDQFRAQLKAIPAVSGIEDNLEPGQPQLHLELTDQGRALGMTTDSLARQVRQSFNGQIVQRYQRNDDEIEVKVRYPESDRQNATDVLNANVRTADGTVIPLSTVARHQLSYTRGGITRIDGKRAVYLTADVDKDTLSASELVAQLKKDVVPDILSQYPGLDIHFAGEAEEQAETESSMLQVFLVAMLVIYMLLAIPLKSYIQPVLIMTAIPFGIVGALIGHWLNDLALGILSLNGIIALSGVVVNDSLLLVARYNDLRKEGLQRREAIIESCTSRMRAVILTSATTFAGLIPLLGETSVQAQFLIPAAVSLAYGILFATAITLVLIPVLVEIQADVESLLKRGVRRLPFTAYSNSTSTEKTQKC